MPSYIPPFGQYGATAGAAAGGAGGGLLGTLGSVLSPLDYPRQALWNAVRAGGNALSGQGTWDDALRAVPGALGAGLAGGLMATGVGAPLGILAGSALGGLAQGVGKSADEEKFKAPEVSDLTGTEDFLPNLLVGALTDPLTYAGGIGGAAKGAKVGRQVGGRLEQAAEVLGPRYGTGADIWSGIMNHPSVGNLNSERSAQLLEHVQHFQQNPSLLSEIAPGSQYLGHGVESVALQRPEGGVTLLTRPSERIDEIAQSYGMPRVDPTQVPPTRPLSEDVLQAVRSKPFPGDFPARVEQVPGQYLVPKKMPAGGDPQQFINELNLGHQDARNLGERLGTQGLDFFDAHMGNVGYDPSGRMRVIDPGAVGGSLGYTLSPTDNQKAVVSMLNEGFSPEHIAEARVPIQRAADMTGAQPGPIQSALLRLLGTHRGVQRGLAEELAAKSVKPGTSPLAEALGAATESPLLRQQLPAQAAKQAENLLGIEQQMARLHANGQFGPLQELSQLWDQEMLKLHGMVGPTHANEMLDALKAQGAATNNMRAGAF
jgi:hypothetical protein